MNVKVIKTEWFQDYKVPSLYIAFPSCSFKCERECGKKMCHNSHLAKMSNIEITPQAIVQNYLSNPITQAVVCGGLEPMDSFDDLYDLVKILRKEYHCNDTVVIYTGYNKDEILGELDSLQEFSNIVVKFGRFIPNQSKHYDAVLGVTLASDNQYAEVIS